MQVWFGDHMFLDKFAFYKGYSIPQGKTIEQYKEAIDLLPLVDTPEVFGLHPNADITYVLVRTNHSWWCVFQSLQWIRRYQSNMAKEVLDIIVNVQPKDSSTGTGETRENIVFHIADDMISKLPPDYIPHEV